MRLAHLSLTDFRNLAAVELSPHERLTVLHGQNGQGKTNLLESVWFLATLRPLRAGRASELVRIGAETARLEGRVVDEVTTRLSVRLGTQGREALADGKRPASVEAWAQTLKVVAFTPDDLEIAKGSPAVRRQWLDRAAFTRRPGHLADHRAYTRAVKHRNRLLKEEAPEASLEPFDETVARAGARLWSRRLAFLDELAPRADARWRSVTGGNLSLGMTYTSDALKAPEWPRDEGALEEVLRAALQRRRRLDRVRGFTTAGPHADDVRLDLDGREVRTYASQGQQRACVLALKVAEIENLRETLGRTPVLLLDDVSSELDPAKNAHLLGYLAEFPGQVLLTTTDPALAPVPEGVPAARVRVEAGRLYPESEG